MTLDSPARLGGRFLFVWISAALWLSASPSTRASDAKYSGKASVPEVGLIAFPPGQWTLEKSRVQKDADVKDQQREYFVFRRTDAEHERFTVLRYNPIVAKRYLQGDGVAEMIHWDDFHFFDGLPDEARMPGAERGDVRLRTDHPHTQDFAETSSVTVFEKRHESWISNSIVYPRNGWVFAMVHASTRVIGPGLAERAEIDSKPLTDLPKGMALIPPNIVGDWSAQDHGIVTSFYLAADGKCTWSSGGMDVLSAGIPGSYDASTHTLTLAGYRYRVNEQKLTMTPARGQKAVASGMDATFQKSKTVSSFSQGIRDSLYGKTSER